MGLVPARWIQAMPNADKQSGSTGRPFAGFGYVFWMAGVACAVTLGYGLLQSRSIRIERLSVPFRGLPQAARGFSILQVSDLHSEANLRLPRRAAEMLQSISAKLMVMTGDFRKAGGSIDAAIRGARILATAVQARMPVYAVEGENDSAEIMTGIQNAGITVLDNRAVLLVAGVWLIGWNPYHAGHPALREIIDTLPEGSAFILASHSPAVMLEEGSTRARLVLSGYTHGGQIRLPFIRPLIQLTSLGPAYARGLHRYGDTLLYINRGLGTTTLPFRIYSPPEIASITLSARP
jgi:predicted MPP superfamily phosphohydrolase